MPQFETDHPDFLSINGVGYNTFEEVPQRDTFYYNGQMFHKLNEAFIVRAKVEDDAIIGDGTAMSFEDLSQFLSSL